ncbi:MAG TPA: tetratricopeptide repeat protein [Dongiaceae bacterium]|nr:tetratricopeptide repeat protein [Dongiaceae bacterium]
MRHWAQLAACAAFFLAVAAPAARAQEPAAQTPEREALRAELDVLLQQLLRDPANLDLLFRYADAAIRLGDYEAAISAYERMLLYNPDLPRVRLELGDLYFRLGAYDVARLYLERAIEGKDVPEAVRQRVAVFLEEIDRRSSPHQVAGSVFAGARYQTNATAGPSSDQIRLEGLDVTLGGDAREKDDVNGFVSATAVHSYDLGAQARHALETRGIAYGSLYATEDQLNLGLLEVDTGPRLFILPQASPGTSARPFAVGQYVFLDDATYFGAFGGGASLRHAFGARVLGEVTAQHRQRRFNNTREQPTADDRDGYVNQFDALARIIVTERDVIDASAYASVTHAEVGFRSWDEYGGRLAYTHSFDSPVGFLRQPWNLTALVSGYVADYDDPDPLVAPSTEREDREWRASGAAAIGITEAVSAVVQVEYRDVDSNIELYEFDNLSATVGGLWRF